MTTWGAVFVGGGAGSLLRYAIGVALQRLDRSMAFPFATLLTNMLATALLAWLVLRCGPYLAGREPWRALLVTGFCGGFSTLSTFSMENHQLLRDGQPVLAILNVILSVGGGILLFHLIARST